LSKRPWIIVGLVSLGLFCLASLWFASSFRPPTEPPPFVVTDSALQQLGTIHVNDLVALRLNRGRLPLLALKALGVVVWLPFFMGWMTFVILLLLYERLRLDVIFLAIGVVFGVVVTGWLSAAFGLTITISAVLFPQLVALATDTPRRWVRAFHMSVATLFFFSALSLSLTTHILLTSYTGFRPASQVEAADLRALFEQLTHEAATADASDAVPSINAARLPRTIFYVNRVAAIGFILSSTLYLIAVWVLIIPAERRPRVRATILRRLRSGLTRPQAASPGAGNNAGDVGVRIAPVRKLLTSLAGRGARRDRDLPHWARVGFALPFYLSVGVAFAILYFNIYIAAAARQNVMLLYADFMQLTDDKYAQLVAAKDSFGPTERIVKQMLELTRERGDKDVSRTLYAARARYWPSAVVAQELPRVNLTPVNRQGDPYDAVPESVNQPSVPQVTPLTQMALDPQLTFTDMLYFSFVSFTTTGYGDIRPISDELRFWTVCENIIEVLFTAMFFVVAMERQR
jgi:hypothetical protein